MRRWLDVLVDLVSGVMHPGGMRACGELGNQAAVVLSHQSIRSAVAMRCPPK